jgi:hypothetical protein
VSEGLWEQAFQLSYFILLDRSRARECVARAIEKLAAQQSRERRRGYWRGRKRDLTIRRIIRPAEDTLQWLIYLESETGEKEQEVQGQPTEADMVVRYVKHLAQMTTGNSSFHVNVGFNRLLRNYTTPEVQQIYELATERYAASEEYRKAKGKLLNQLASRFERFLRLRTAQYGEVQFETHQEHERWSGIVEESLERFAPWSGRQSCFLHGAPHGRSSGMPDRLETNRCHWFMHSTCYGRLAEQLGFDPPRERLAVPRFLHHDGGDRGCQPASFERRTAPLSNEETVALRERMDRVRAPSGEIALVRMKIVSHGTVCATLDPTRDERRRFEIPEGTRLLEVWSDAGAEGRILATHWMDCGAGNEFIAGEYAIALEGGRQLALSVIPTKQTDEQGGGTRAVVEIESRSVSSLTEHWRSLASMFDRKSLLRPMLASLALVALGGLLSSLYMRTEVSQQRVVIGRMAHEIADQKAAVAALEHTPREFLPSSARYSFSLATPNLRGAGSPGEPVVTFAPGQTLAILELPVQDEGPALYRVSLSSFPQEQELLTEMALRPLERADHWIIEFALPAALVEGDTHYVLTLTQTKGAQSGRYLLQVRKGR